MYFRQVQYIEILHSLTLPRPKQRKTCQPTDGTENGDDIKNIEMLIQLTPISPHPPRTSRPKPHLHLPPDTLHTFICCRRQRRNRRPSPAADCLTRNESVLLVFTVIFPTTHTAMGSRIKVRLHDGDPSPMTFNKFPHLGGFGSRMLWPGCLSCRWGGDSDHSDALKSRIG